MKPELFLIKEILSLNKIKNVLDIGAWKWYASLLCASYGAKVDAIDNSSQSEFLFPKLLFDHPKISFYDLSIEKFEFNKIYDLVIITNLIMFLDKKLFIDIILPKICSSLSENGYIVISFFLPDDQNMNANMSSYNLSDFKLNWFSIIKNFDKIFLENHPPLWEHSHHINYLVLKKGQS